MKKGKLAAIIISAVLLVGAASGAVFYYITHDHNDKITSDELRKGMKRWNAPSLSGLYLFVPEEYQEKEKKDYDVSYIKDNAQISLMWETVDNDLENYVIYAINSYKEITDSFSITNEYDEEISGGKAHIVEFDYTLELESETKSISCLSAFLINNGTVYVLTCTADSDKYSSYSEDFRRTYKTMTARNDNDSENGSNG